MRSVRNLDLGALSAGVNYTRMLDGALDFVLYQRSLPWDHAAGVLLLAEAGGVTVRPDGSPYRGSGSNGAENNEIRVAAGQVGVV
ncbi:inositol monophosphatase family protein [Nocardia carnea]|uniref:inositol monophosphatase family protein n=1 Tax=Nocardia carnea TaxID=37328 RepID=UPI003D773B6A